MDLSVFINNKPKLIYENSLSSPNDIKGFILEGEAIISFPNNSLRMENKISSESGQKANYVFWCPKKFPADILIQWDFLPIKEPGLAMIFFAAMGKHKDLFDKNLSPRTGDYVDYHHSDINAFHASYFRRKEPDERAFHTCNLRKSYGFHLVAQGGDPIPNVEDITSPYTITVYKYKSIVKFYVNDLLVFEFIDDRETYGSSLGEGYIGFRQLAPMIAEYSSLKVYSLE